LAKFSTSATRISEEIYLKEAVYRYYSFFLFGDGGDRVGHDYLGSVQVNTAVG
jgi:hypothetical protein